MKTYDDAFVKAQNRRNGKLQKCCSALDRLYCGKYFLNDGINQGICESSALVRFRIFAEIEDDEHTKTQTQPREVNLSARASQRL